MNKLKNKIVVVSGFSACVDGDTEYFNGTRWIKIKDYSEGDEVLQYHSDGTTNLTYPQKYIKEPCKEMWYFRTKHGLNQCLTDEHEVYYITSKNNLYHKTFKEIREQHNSNKNGFSGKFITTFNYGGKGIELTDNEIKLMCAVICDSSFPNGTNKCFFNLKKDRKKNALRKLLKEMNYEWEEKEYDSMKGYTRFFLNAPRKEKEFSPYWYNCNQHQLKIICDNIIQWDGSTSSDSIRFFSTSKDTADFIQFAFSACGIRANLLENDRRGRIKYNETTNKEYITKSIDYVINICNSKLLSLIRDKNKKIEFSKYITKDGFKYCFTVPSGILVLRRDGCIFITGNCGKDSIQKYISDNYNYQMVISHSSRPMRPNEDEGNPYYFITRKQFEDMIKQNEFIECRKYNTLVNNVNDVWYYGVSKNSIDLTKNNYIVVLDILGLIEIKKYFKDNVISFFIDVDEPIRKQRAINRQGFDPTEWDRRYQDDIKSFSQEVINKEVDYIIENYDFDKCVSEILSKIGEI